MASEDQIDVSLKKFEKILCRFLKECTDTHDGRGPPTKEWCDAPGSEPGKTKGMERGSAIDKCCEEKVKAENRKPKSVSGFPDNVMAQTKVYMKKPPEGLGGFCKPDVIVGRPPKCDGVYDFKTSCPPLPADSPQPAWPMYGDGTNYTRKVENKNFWGKRQNEVAAKACGKEPVMIHANSDACK